MISFGQQSQIVNTFCSQPIVFISCLMICNLIVFQFPNPILFSTSQHLFLQTALFTLNLFMLWSVICSTGCNTTPKCDFLLCYFLLCRWCCLCCAATCLIGGNMGQKTTQTPLTTAALLWLLNTWMFFWEIFLRLSTTTLELKKEPGWKD